MPKEIRWNWIKKRNNEKMNWSASDCVAAISLLFLQNRMEREENSRKCYFHRRFDTLAHMAAPAKSLNQFRCLAFGAIEWCKLFANVDGGGKSPVQRIKLSQLKISRTTFTTLQWVAGRHLLIRTLTVAVSAWSMVQSAWQKSKNSNYNK